jgi:hypothetical protein
VTGRRARMLIGTHTYAAADVAGQRQAAAVDSLRALHCVELVNLQLTRAPHHVPGISTLATLTRTSNEASGLRGPVKAIMSDLFDALAAEATARRLPYFCFTNGDVSFSQDAVDWMLEEQMQAYVFSREDFDRTTGNSGGPLLSGIDVIAIATDWWHRNRGRFRHYIVGEPAWDNVYAAILLCHANTAIENRRGLVRHEDHPRAWLTSPFAEYTRLLAAYDAGYFSLWCRYVEALQRMRAAGSTAEQEAALASEVFVWRPSARQRAVQVGRNVKARVRYAWRRIDRSG